MITTSVATNLDSEDILRVTNDAFMADAFFKKPEFFNRFSKMDVDKLLRATNSLFILAKTTSNNDTIVCGSLHLSLSYTPPSSLVDFGEVRIGR